ncbi:hypothetical protein [Mycobacteroides franklinii]|uniref:hypothetical protein n=1 Tax=Mycobacteroides franklinii TaxID=948102 RepID=UPI0010420D18|nr:hypothetical protein [Mycobacteroides franklinii]
MATITSVGTAAKPINCEIEYQVPQQPATYPDEGLSDVPGLPRLLQSGQRYSVTGGTEAVDHVGSMCFKRLFTGYEDAEGKEMISYSLSVSGNAIGAQDPTPRCQDLEPLVNASRPFAAHPTLRADSRRLPQSKLMNVDPCAVIDALSGQPKVEISTPIYPFSCAFKPEGGTKRSITLLFEEADAARRSIEPAKSGRSSVNKYLDLLGAQATISASGGDCMLIAYLDLDRPISGSDPLSQKPWIPKVMVNAEDENASCPKAVEAATEVVRLYKEAK